MQIMSGGREGGGRRILDRLESNAGEQRAKVRRQTKATLLTIR